MSSTGDIPHAPDEPRFVVDVTAPLPPDQANPVANEVAARLSVPVATMLKLLSNRVGPVTKPVKVTTAERVAGILTRAGVEVAVRPYTPQSSDHPMPEKRHTLSASESDASPLSENDGDGYQSHEPQHASAESGPEAWEAPEGEPDGARRSAAGEQSTDRTAGEGMNPTLKPTVLESEPLQPESANASGSAVEVGEATQSAASDVEYGQDAGGWPDEWAVSDRDEAEGDFGTWVAPTPTPPPSTSSVTPSMAAPVRLEDDEAPPSTLVGPPTEPTAQVPLAPNLDAAGKEAGTPAWFDHRAAEEAAWQESNPFAEADRQDRITRRWTLGVALVIALAALVTLQWIYG